MKAGVAFVVTVFVVASSIVLYHAFNASDLSASRRVTKVKRGDLVSTISATGTIEPEDVVDVGAQVAGRITSLGDPKNPQQKPIDFGASVEEGTVLAKLDDATYKFQVEYAEATLQRARADLMQAEARLEQALDEWERARVLVNKAIAKNDYFAIVANYRTAKANVESWKAAIKQNEALLQIARTNLNNTVVKSPVRGIIIDHHASVGRSVTPGPSGPGLFVIAKNLHRMKVCASVNESDIGQIHVGMPVQFAVDTYPDDVFHGKVTQVRLNAAMTQDAVTYTVVVAADNAHGKLLPHQTAHLRFELEQRRNVLMVPNTALRWRPRPQQLPPDVRESFAATSAEEESGVEGAVSDPALEGKKIATNGRAREDERSLWLDDGKFVRPIKVRIGASDGLMTEVSGSELREGMEVVVGDDNSYETGSEKSSTFRLSDPGGNRPSRPQAAMLSFRATTR